MADPLTLSMAAFLTLAGQCGGGIAPATLADLLAHESKFSTIAININGANGGTVKNIKTKEQAIALAKTLYHRKVNFDAGIAQINSRNFEWLGLTPETVFNPCRSIKAQADLLQSFSMYNTGNKTKGFSNGYVNKIVAGQPAVRQAMNEVWQREEQKEQQKRLETPEKSDKPENTENPEKKERKIIVPEFP